MMGPLLTMQRARKASVRQVRQTAGLELGLNLHAVNLSRPCMPTIAECCSAGSTMLSGNEPRVAHSTADGLGWRFPARIVHLELILSKHLLRRNCKRMGGPAVVCT